MDEQRRIGFLGAGAMTRALAPAWIATGHDIVIGARRSDQARALAAEVGARAGTLADAAAHAGTAVLAVRWEGVDWTLEHVGGALAGKVLVDVTNPVETEGFGLTTRPGSSLAEEVEARSGALVVKAFNLAQASVWEAPRVVGGEPLAVPIATDHAVAREVAAALIADLGDAVLDAGELRHARHLEAMAAVVIRRLSAGDPPSSTFAWVR